MRDQVVADWNGVPINPETDGWHWLRFNMTDECQPTVDYWLAAERIWRSCSVTANVALQYDYLGPCLTPNQVAAAVQADRAACLSDLNDLADGLHDNGQSGHAAGVCRAIDAIRARGDTSALDAAIKAAEAREREVCAAGLDAAATMLRLRDAEDRGIPDHMGHSFEANAAEAWAKMIRARSEKGDGA